MDDLKVKIVDMAIMPRPTVTRSGFQVLATFTLLAEPLRIVDCKLAISPKGNPLIWTPHVGVKPMGWARDALGDLAFAEFQVARMGSVS